MSFATLCFAQVIIGKAVGTKEALYDLDVTSHYDKPRDDQVGETFEVRLSDDAPVSPFS